MKHELTAHEREVARRLDDSMEGAAVSRWFDRDGDSITFGEWAVLFNLATYRSVALHRVGRARVSTVWLGRNHGFDGPPLIFETMVFGGAHDGHQVRYSTEDQARAGHDRCVRMVARRRWWFARRIRPIDPSKASAPRGRRIGRGRR